jgi:hypothetical protein
LWSGSQLIDRMLCNVCGLCGSTVEIEMYHMRGLKDICGLGGVGKSLWMVCMIVINRKTWWCVLCVMV